MKKTLTKIAFLVVMFTGSCLIQAQLGASDTSARSVNKYKNIINSNRDVVSFIEQTFYSKGLPKHLKNLALIESGFNQSVVSHAGAKGMWQFMTGHANDYGLTESERDDIYKSTQIAAVSLANLYNKHKNWVTVVAAYNCGDGNIQKAIQRSGSNRYLDFYKYLPNETINHVQKYLNACYATGELNEVLNDYQKSLLALRTGSGAKSNNGANINLIDTNLEGAFDVHVIAKYLDIPSSKLLSWNPGILNELDMKGESRLYLPSDLMVTFLLNKNKILSESLKSVN